MSNAEQAAYPVHPEHERDVRGNSWGSIGLTKRELIAAMAMQGLLSGGILGWGDVDQRADAVAQRAARQADALLAELERRDD